MSETASSRLFPISLKPTSPVVGGPNNVLRKSVDIKAIVSEEPGVRMFCHLWQVVDESQE